MTSFEGYARAKLPRLLRTATAICGDQHLAEEIVQDLLEKLNTRWESVRQSANVDAYVRRMLVNQHLTWRRKWGRLIPTDDVGPDRHAPDHAARIADRDLLAREVAKLPSRYRIALALRYFDGLSDQQIADAMGCGESTVRSYISRGLSDLRVEMSMPAQPHGGAR